MKKNIILCLLISSSSLSALADGVFNMQIPQPDFISNDWDGDGIQNIEDIDDDNDGIDDVNDSSPFDLFGQSSAIGGKFSFWKKSQETVPFRTEYFSRPVIENHLSRDGKKVIMSNYTNNNYDAFSIYQLNGNIWNQIKYSTAKYTSVDIGDELYIGTSPTRISVFNMDGRNVKSININSVYSNRIGLSESKVSSKALSHGNTEALVFMYKPNNVFYINQLLKNTETSWDLNQYSAISAPEGWISSYAVSHDHQFIFISNVNSNNKKGSIFVYKRVGDTFSWVSYDEQPKIDGNIADVDFGGFLKIDADNNLIVSSSLYDHDGFTNSGALTTLVFNKTSKIWEHKQIITLDTPSDNATLGKGGYNAHSGTQWAMSPSGKYLILNKSNEDIQVDGYEIWMKNNSGIYEFTFNLKDVEDLDVNLPNSTANTNDKNMYSSISDEGNIVIGGRNIFFFRGK